MTKWKFGPKYNEISKFSKFLIFPLKAIDLKYFEAKIYEKNNKYLLIKNDKFNFLKNMPIFPMKEVKEKKYKFSNYKKINIKLSNMDMKIILNKIDKFPNLTNKILLEKDNSKSKILPSFTKKIFNSIHKI